MRRSLTWRTALLEYIHSVARLPFVWGQHDCAIFAAGAIEAMTGVDIAAPYRGRYKSMKGGLRCLKRKGFGDHPAYFASFLDEVAPSMAQVGDIAVLVECGQPVMGVVQGERVYVLRPDADGIGTVSLLEAQRVFRVPFTDGNSVQPHG